MWRSGNETVRRVEGLEFYSGRRLFLFVFFYSSILLFFVVPFSGYAATGLRRIPCHFVVSVAIAPHFRSF